jgi:hypothetical protein
LVQAEYKKKAAPTHIVAGAGSGAKGKQVVVLTPDGTQAASFSPFTSPESVRVATGDLDGSGLDKIVVTDNKRSIKVFTFEGAELASYQFSHASSKDVETAVADLDGDGKAEIIVGAQNSSSKKREIKLLAYTAKKLEEKAALSIEDKERKFALAAGDINGDMVPELLVDRTEHGRSPSSCPAREARSPNSGRFRETTAMTCGSRPGTSTAMKLPRSP